MDDYTMPFYVGTSPEMKRRFPYARNGYLPPLLLPEQETEPAPDQQWFEHRHEKIESLVLDLQNRLNKHIDSSMARKQDRL